MAITLHKFIEPLELKILTDNEPQLFYETKVVFFT